MSFDVQTRIQENPVEAVAIATAVGFIGVAVFQNRKIKRLQLELELAQLRAATAYPLPPESSGRSRRRHKVRHFS